jgi:hypothetical protein
MTHPYLSQQLARQREDDLRRQAELARLAAANRPPRRVFKALRMFRSGRKGAVAPPVGFGDGRPLERLAKNATNSAPLAPVRSGEANPCVDS